MGRLLTRTRLGAAIVGALLATAACDLDLENPNAPDREEALSDADGVIGLAVGLQDRYAENVLEFIRASALVTDEWGTSTRALAADQSLFNGQGIDPAFGVVADPYRAAFRVVNQANELIAAAPQVGLAPGTQTGIIALAKTFKAMALGTIVEQYERVPIDVAVGGAELQDRPAVYAEIIRLLESARADLTTNPDLGEFTSRVQGTGFDLPNTINAMLARYYLFSAANANDPAMYQMAIEAADRVDLTKVSIFTYASPDFNPIWNYSTAGGLRYIAPLSDWVAEAEPGDARPEFWVNTAAKPVAGNPPTALLLPLRQYSVRDDPFPVYIPDEMRLIKAEAYARLGEFEQALDLINEVRTQPATPGDVLQETDPKAGLPPLTPEQVKIGDPLADSTQAAILRQVAYERKYELYEQGLRWPDTRRLDPYIDEEPVIEYLPLPNRECQTNPLAGC